MAAKALGMVSKVHPGAESQIHKVLLRVNRNIGSSALGKTVGFWSCYQGK